LAGLITIRENFTYNYEKYVYGGGKMKLIRECRTCEFNFDGMCAGEGEGATYQYGEKIIDDTKNCDDWGASLEYYSDITEKAPWYIREDYKRYRISYDEFLKKLDDDEKGVPIKVNLYDAIENIYNLRMDELAKVLNVTIGVIGYARSRGTVAKRVADFSCKLCIPAKFFNHFTTHNFEELKRCQDIFSDRKVLKLREKH
jgi:hypothetical protein